MRIPTAAAVLVPAMAVLLAAGAVAGQQDDQEWLRNCKRQAEGSERAVFCEVRTLTTPLSAGALAVNAGPNGGVSVQGGAVTDARISARIQTQAESDARAREIAREVQVEAAAGRVRSEGPRTGRRESWSVSYAITVPQRADLDLEAVNGPVTIRDVEGRIRAQTTNGPLNLDRLAGDVRARTTNGPLNVTVTGSRWEGSGLDAATTNGPVNLRIPEGYSASLQTGSVNGPMSLDFPIMVTATTPTPATAWTCSGASSGCRCS
jgi:DUF4097 and DUF4098 domain-containing protein YvlB